MCSRHSDFLSRTVVPAGSATVGRAIAERLLPLTLLFKVSLQGESGGKVDLNCKAFQVQRTTRRYSTVWSFPFHPQDTLTLESHVTNDPALPITGDRQTPCDHDGSPCLSRQLITPSYRFTSPPPAPRGRSVVTSNASSLEGSDTSTAEASDGPKAAFPTNPWPGLMDRFIDMLSAPSCGNSKRVLFDHSD